MKPKQKVTFKYRPWAWAIVDGYGKPFMDECCVCEDKSIMEEICEDLNSGEYIEWSNKSYKVVRLYFRGKR